MKLLLIAMILKNLHRNFYLIKSNLNPIKINKTRKINFFKILKD